MVIFRCTLHLFFLEGPLVQPLRTVAGGQRVPLPAGGSAGYQSFSLWVCSRCLSCSHVCLTSPTPQSHYLGDHNLAMMQKKFRKKNEKPRVIHDFCLNSWHFLVAFCLSTILNFYLSLTAYFSTFGPMLQISASLHERREQSVKVYRGASERLCLRETRDCTVRLVLSCWWRS